MSKGPLDIDNPFNRNATMSPEEALRLATPEHLQTPPANPLAAYFRQPGAHVALPTKGAFLPPGTLSTAMDGTLVVYPKTAADEILLKSPDALMSGFALEKLIESCVPGIKYPRMVSSPDLDAILLAIHVASEGNTMSFKCQCPKCKEENTYDANLLNFLSNMRCIDPEQPVRIDENLVVYVKPYDLNTVSQITQATFMETRNIKIAEAREEIPAVIEEMSRRAMLKLQKLNLLSLSESIVKIVIAGTTVVERPFINEFMQKIDGKKSAKISDRISEINGSAMDKTMNVACVKCKHEWTTTVDFDPVSFFVQGS